jgi:hypothetical protein
MATFKLNDTKPKLTRYDVFTLEEYISRVKAIPKDTKVLYVETETTPSEKDVDIYNQGFLSTLYYAYSNHMNLVIFPDDFWLTILFSLNNYMEFNSETLRKVFVQHEGKAQMIIDTEGAFQDQNWSVLLTLFEKKISENITPGMADALIPNFTTTTPHLRSVSQILLMGVLKKYFAYGIMTLCGIPSVTMKGTLEDWKKLQDKIQFLATLSPDLSDWVQILTPIIDKLIDSYQNNPDITWWNKVINYIGGSGRDDISGWALAFFPFYKGKWQLQPVKHILETGEYGSVGTSKLEIFSNVHVPVKYNEYGKMHDVFLYAESRRVSVDAETFSVKTSFDYAILQVPDGTITEAYDWHDRSVKVVEKSITNHQHPLKFEIDPYALGMARCDLCRRNCAESWRCALCNFDVCKICIENQETSTCMFGELSDIDHTKAFLERV